MHAPMFLHACVDKVLYSYYFLLIVCLALPAGRIVIATTAVTVTVGTKTAIAGGRMTIFIYIHTVTLCLLHTCLIPPFSSFISGWSYHLLIAGFDVLGCHYKLMTKLHTLLYHCSRFQKKFSLYGIHKLILLWYSL